MKCRLCGLHHRTKEDQARDHRLNPLLQGEKNGRARLTKAQVDEAKRLYSLKRYELNKERVSTYSLALDYDVSQSTMWYALKGKTWKALKMAAGLVFFATLIGCQSLHHLLGAPGNEPEDKTIVVAGQSNMVTADTWVDLDRSFKTDGVTIHIINVAVSATNSENWDTDAGGIRTAFVKACAQYRPDWILWGQGEGDAGTTKELYAERIGRVLDAAKQASPQSKIFVSLTSFHPFGYGDPRGGQLMLIEQGKAIRGPDMDAIRSDPANTRDTLHLNAAGCQIFADQWFEILKFYL